MRHALPRLHALEHTHGSVMKALGSMMRPKARRGGAPAVAGRMSFAGGLQELPDALARELHAEIRFGAGHADPARAPRDGR